MRAGRIGRWIAQRLEDGTALIRCFNKLKGRVWTRQQIGVREHVPALRLGDPLRSVRGPLLSRLASPTNSLFWRRRQDNLGSY